MKKILALSFLFLTVQAAHAASIVKLPLGETVSSDVRFDGSVFGTIDDGNGATIGNQNTQINYVGVFESLFSDVLNNDASFTLSGVTASGDATENNGLISQATTGGTFSLYDGSNSLLLEGQLQNGVIAGSSAASTGSFFNTNLGTFTGGSLLPYLSSTSAGLSLALANILSGSTPGLQVFTEFEALRLSPFTADASGIIEGVAGGAPVPEPAAALLLLSGLLAGATARRKAAKV